MTRKIRLWAGIVVAVSISLACLLGPLIFKTSYLATDISSAYLHPVEGHILGTDGCGRDVLIRLLYGGRISVFVGLVATITEVFICVTIGMISGLSGKTTDRVLMGFSDIVMCLPVICIVLITGSVLADLNVGMIVRVSMTAIVIALLGWPMTARLIRARVRSLKESDFIKSARILGLPRRSIMFTHLLPNLAPQILTSVTLASCSAILSEATLSFLGFGISFPYPSWGNIIASVSSKGVLLDRWWVWVPACIAITVLILAINLIGENLIGTSENDGAQMQ